MFILISNNYICITFFWSLICFKALYTVAAKGNIVAYCLLQNLELTTSFLKCAINIVTF